MSKEPCPTFRFAVNVIDKQYDDIDDNYHGDAFLLMTSCMHAGLVFAESRL